MKRYLCDLAICCSLAAWIGLSLVGLASPPFGVVGRLLGLSLAFAVCFLVLIVSGVIVSLLTRRSGLGFWVGAWLGLSALATFWSTWSYGEYVPFLQASSLGLLVGALLGGHRVPE